jgi:hypothetical protein
MAASAQGIKAGQSYVEMGLFSAPLTVGLKIAEAKLKAFGASITSIGTKLLGLGSAIYTPFIGAAKVFENVGSELVDMSARTGMSIENLSALGHAASQTGSDLATVEKGARKMQQNLLDAATGSTLMQEVFGALGLSAQKLIRLHPDQQFEAIATALGKIQNPSAKAAMAMKVFGKAGTALLPMITDMKVLTDEARNMSLVISTEDAQAADALGDSMGLLGDMIKKVTIDIGAALAPALTILANIFSKALKSVIDWVSANRPLVVVVVAAGVAIAGLGAALVVLGVTISAAGVALGAISAVIGAVLSPVTLLVAALVAGGVAFFQFTNVGQQALGWLSAGFGDLLAVAQSTFGGIADALKAGNIELAMKILMTGLKILWLKGVAFLKSKWADWGESIMGVVDTVKFNIARSFTNLWSLATKGLVNFTSTFGTGWLDLVSMLMKSWNKFGGFFAQVWERIKNLFTGGDLQAELDRINKDVEAKNAKVDKDIAGAKKFFGGGQKSLDQIERDRQAAIAALRDEQAAAPDARRKAAIEDLTAAEKELADAQADLTNLTKEAAKEGAAADLPALKKRAPSFTPEDIEVGIEQAQKKIDVKGTFSAVALRGLSSGDSIANDQLSEQKKTNDNLERLRRDIRDRQAAFE